MHKTVTIDYLSTLTDISDIQEADLKNLMGAAKEQAKVMLEKFEVKCKKNKVGVMRCRVLMMALFSVVVLN